jgi:hypothetical protein
MHRMPAMPQRMVSIEEEARSSPPSHRAHADLDEDVGDARRLVDQEQQMLGAEALQASGLSFEAVRRTASAPCGS